MEEEDEEEDEQQMEQEDQVVEQEVEERGMEEQQDGVYESEGVWIFNLCSSGKSPCYAFNLESYEDIVKRLQEMSALFILGIKEKYKLTQAAVQGIQEGVTNLMQVESTIFNLLKATYNPLQILNSTGVHDSTQNRG